MHGYRRILVLSRMSQSGNQDMHVGGAVAPRYVEERYVWPS